MWLVAVHPRSSCWQQAPGSAKCTAAAGLPISVQAHPGAHLHFHIRWGVQPQAVARHRTAGGVRRLCKRVLAQVRVGGARCRTAADSWWFLVRWGSSSSSSASQPASAGQARPAAQQAASRKLLPRRPRACRLVRCVDCVAGKHARRVVGCVTCLNAAGVCQADTLWCLCLAMSWLCHTGLLMALLSMMLSDYGSATSCCACQELQHHAAPARWCATGCQIRSKPLRCAATASLHMAAAWAGGGVSIAGDVA
jgi:hypothetical protein